MAQSKSAAIAKLTPCFCWLVASLAASNSMTTKTNCIYNILKNQANNLENTLGDGAPTSPPLCRVSVGVGTRDVDCRFP